MKPTKKQLEMLNLVVDSIGYGGRLSEEHIKMLASHTVVDLLKIGLTLEQAEKVLRNAALEAARIAGEKQFDPKVPGLEVKREKK